jgi:FK506-binding nuclear protein
MAFFGLQVTTGKTAWIDGSEEEPIAITNACLVKGGAGKKGNARVAIQMCVDPDEGEANASAPVIGVLSLAPGGIENLKLELLINSRMGVKLVGADATGAVVHLVGRHVPTDEEEEEEDEMDVGELDLDQLTEDQLAALAEATGNGDLNGRHSHGGEGCLDCSDDSDDDESDDGDDDDDDDDDEDDDGGGGDDGDVMDDSDGGDEAAAGATGGGAAARERRAARLAGREGGDDGKAVVASRGGKVVTHASGLKYQDLLVGTGRTPTVGRNVAIKYTLRLESGKVVDRSGKMPFKFRLGIGECIKGMDLGVAGMREGGSRHLIIGAKLGYGKQGAPPDIPRNATLFFDVELVRAWK